MNKHSKNICIGRLTWKYMSIYTWKYMSMNRYINFERSEIKYYQELNA